MSAPNIAVLVLDSVRLDRCSTYGYHRETTNTLTQIGDEGYVFTNAYATGSWTVPSHGSLFTGALPTVHGAHAQHRYFDAAVDDTLPGRLSTRGYETLCFTANPWLTDSFGFDTGFDQVRDFTTSVPFPDAGDPRQLEVDASTAGGLTEVLKWIAAGDSFRRLGNSISLKFADLSLTDAGEINGSIEQWLAGRERDDPFFLFANYMDAHDPYSVVPGRDAFCNGAGGDIEMDWNLRSLTDPPTVSNERIDDAYDSAVHYLDSRVGDLLDAMDRTGVLDDTLVVVLSDHGQCLGEHDYWGHGTFLHEELLRVPLVIRPPGGCDRVNVDELVSIRDLYDLVTRVSSGATTAEAIASIPDPNQGRVVAESTGKHQNVDVPTDVYSSLGYRATVIEDRLCIRDADDGRTTVVDLDAGTADWTSKLEAVERRALERGEIEPLEDAEKSRTDIGDTTKQQLENLGYM